MSSFASCAPVHASERDSFHAKPLSVKASLVLGLAAAAADSHGLHNNAMARLLACTPVHAIVPSQQVVSLVDTDSIGACVHAMTQHSISSLPITCHDVCVGFLDLLDIARFIVAHAPNLTKVSQHDLTAFADKVYFQTPASVLLSHKRNAFVCIGDQEPASTACSVLAQGHHRVAVYSFPQNHKDQVRLDTKGGQMGCSTPSTSNSVEASRAQKATMGAVCAQSDIIRFLADKACKDMSTEMRQLLALPIQSFQGCGLPLQSEWLPSPPAFVAPSLIASSVGDRKSPEKIERAAGGHVLCISEDATVLGALEKLVMTNSSCLAVVNAAGDLVGNFSVSDLEPCFALKADIMGKGTHLSEITFVASLFFVPLREYLHRHRSLALTPVVEQNPNAPLGFIMKRMVDEDLHHIWLLNKGSKKPAGIITLTDLLRVVCLYHPPGSDFVCCPPFFLVEISLINMRNTCT
jgi:CBS domain-containing protein